MEAEDSNATVVTMYMIVATLCVAAEIWCVIATINVCKNPTSRSSISLIVFLIAINGTLCFRLLTCFGASFDTYPDFWDIYFICIVILAKDVLVISVVCRVYSALEVLQGDAIWSRLVYIMYIFLGAHIVIYYVLMTLEALDILTKWDVIPYTVAMQLIVFGVLISGTIVFYYQKSKLEENPTFVRWISFVLIYMNFQLVYQTVNNILVITGVHHDMDNEAEAIYESVLILFTDIITCVVLASFLYILAKEDNAPDDDVISVD